jgi:hypothetical protein
LTGQAADTAACSFLWGTWAWCVSAVGHMDVVCVSSGNGAGSNAGLLGSDADVSEEVIGMLHCVVILVLCWWLLVRRMLLCVGSVVQ